MIFFGMARSEEQKMQSRGDAANVRGPAGIFCAKGGKHTMYRRTSGALLAIGAALLLCGCAGFRVHDEARSKVATETRQAYTQAKITEVPQADARNLEAMLAAELDVLREASRNELDIALLKIANNSTPMGYTFIEGMGRLQDLGVRTLTDLRELRKRQAILDGEIRKLETERKAVLAAGNGNPVPPCDKLTDETPIPKGLQEAEKKSFEESFAGYRQICQKIHALMDPGTEGRIAAAYTAWRSAKSELDAAVALQKAEEARVKEARRAYDDAVKARAEAEAKGPELEKAIADKARALAAAVESAKKIDKGVEHAPFIDSLLDLLTATAGGSVDPKDPELQGAIAVAKQIPSLAGDIAALEARRAAPPVSGLLIALRHQALQADSAKKRAALEAERVAILKTKYDIYMKAAQRWQLYFDATCNYAALGAGKGHPGTGCNEFDVAKVDPDVDPRRPGAVRCTLKAEELQDCLLNRPWKEQLRAHRTQNESYLRRQLYESVAAYLQAITLQARALEQTMREIDVRHRQTLLAKQTAIEQWDNLVGVPLEQLDAYYKAGIKPAELADLIVKALGFTAIAIGVAQ